MNREEVRREELEATENKLVPLREKSLFTMFIDPQELDIIDYNSLSFSFYMVVTALISSGVCFIYGWVE